MHVMRSLVLLSLFVGTGLTGVGTVTPDYGPAIFFAGIAVLFVGLLFGCIVILLSNARKPGTTTYRGRLP